MEDLQHTECCPIKQIEELKEWEPSFVKYASAPLRKRIPVDDSPKTLICHDMRGGYLEDKFVHGCKAEDCYYFIHWSLVDSFVYFSHHLVTIPPCGWISAAHQNGVKVLGTFITEWDAGEKVCEELFKDSNNVLHYSRQLVRIAAFYNFDGWLINIENKLKINQIPLLKQFINVLTDMMHSFRSHSLVIWYDSVIESGDLKWQNALNEHNRDFFYGCDGIFLNYNWKDEDLKLSVSEAGLRKTDVYVGLDVFGRGCLGGGGFSTNIAAEEARKYGLSIAIFAPGWVHECLDVKDFPVNQQKFWSALNEVCTARAFKNLPFASSFCPGFGKKLFRNGKVVCNEPWYNISLQQPQPTFYSSHSSKGNNVVMHIEDAYNGGGCLCLNGRFNDCKKFYDFMILSTEFALENSYIISYTFKSLVNGLDVTLILDIQCYEGSYELCLTEEKENEIIPVDASVKYKMPASRNELLNTTYKETDENLLYETNWIKR
ncbi:Cytosolic endo-beta-N-acetylglucosaminidase, partial [Stegodyphus mimosarum]